MCVCVCVCVFSNSQLEIKTYIFLRKDFLNHLLSQPWRQLQHATNQEQKASYCNNPRASENTSEIIQQIFKETDYN
jgi:hypothetical protein